MTSSDGGDISEIQTFCLKRTNKSMNHFVNFCYFSTVFKSVSSKSKMSICLYNLHPNFSVITTPQCISSWKVIVVHGNMGLLA